MKRVRRAEEGPGLGDEWAEALVKFGGIDRISITGTQRGHATTSTRTTIPISVRRDWCPLLLDGGVGDVVEVCGR